jgi:cell division protein FtsX
LVGSPLAFIRGPFVVEGLIQGGLGSLGALVGLWAGFLAAAAWWPALAGVAGDLPPAFLPVRLCAALVLGGMAVGAAGGFAASRHAV